MTPQEYINNQLVGKTITLELENTGEEKNPSIQFTIPPPRVWRKRLLQFFPTFSFTNDTQDYADLFRQIDQITDFMINMLEFVPGYEWSGEQTDNKVLQQIVELKPNISGSLFRGLLDIFIKAMGIAEAEEKNSEPPLDG